MYRQNFAFVQSTIQTPPIACHVALASLNVLFGMINRVAACSVFNLDNGAAKQQEFHRCQIQRLSADTIGSYEMISEL
jgi:hypothetical protein